MPTPPNQQFLTIMFSLIGGGPEVDYILSCRPEDLTYNDPAFLDVERTLGGSRVDDWGQGLPTITMSGTTGWRGSFLLSGSDAYSALRSVVFDEWFSRRQTLVQNGSDPNAVELILTDSLNYRCLLVVPRSFQLRRSRTRPLLYTYNIQLTAIADAASNPSILDQITSALNDPERWLAGVTGLGDAILEAQFVLVSAQNAIGSIGAAIATFVNTGVGIMQSICSLANTVQGAFDATSYALLSVGQTYCLAGESLFGAVAATPGLTPQQALPLMNLASIFGGAACLIRNSFNVLPLYPTYEALVGASFCSSTGGGDPPSSYTPSENPWADITPAVTPPIAVTTAAQAAMANIVNGDPLLLIGQTASVGTQMATIGGGVTVT